MSEKIVIFPKSRAGSKMSIRADCAIVFDPNPKNIRPLAEAAVKVVQREIASIKDPPARATIKRRGPGRLFNVTGRLRRGIKLKSTSRGFEIEAPVDRLKVRPVRDRLKEVAPNLFDSKALHAAAMGEADVRGMMKKTIYKKRGWAGRAFGWLKGKF